MLIAAPAFAAGPVGPNGARLTTSDYRVDLTQTPILAGARVTGLAGAYVSIAEGTDGNLQNAAAPALRVPWSVDPFDYDLGVGLSFPSSFENNDFFNTGRSTQIGNTNEDGFLFLSAAANLQFQEWGVGLSLDYQPYGLQNSAAQVDDLNSIITTGRLQIARMWLDHQLVVGLGLRVISLSVERSNPPPGEPRQLFSSQSGGLEIGAIWKPNEQPYRIGVSARSQVLTDPNLEQSVPANAVGDFVIGDPASTAAIFLPSQAALPWDVHVGLALQFGARPLNPRWVNPGVERNNIEKRFEKRAKLRQRYRTQQLAGLRQNGRLTPEAVAAVDAELEREAFLDEQQEERLNEEHRAKLKAQALALERFYVLVSTSLLVTGEVKDAVGMESFLRQEVDRSGEAVTLSPRLGIEMEAVPHWIKVRGGTYYEQTRFDNGLASDRIHGTFGLDVKLFPWTVFGIFDEPTFWRAGAVIDGSQRFFSWGVTAGIWH